MRQIFRTINSLARYSSTKYFDSFYQEDEDIVIVDPCVESSMPKLEEFFEKEDLEFSSVKHIVVTHIHLDHCGGVGKLLKKCDNCTVLAHPATVRHLIDPKHVIEGTKEVYGGFHFGKWFGEVVPCDEDRLRGVKNEEIVEIGEKSRKLTFYHRKGHSDTHVIVHDNFDNALFVGDNFGVQYEDSSLLPICPPTEFDSVKGRETLDFIASLKPDKIYMTHYGEYKKDIAKGIERLKKNYLKIQEIIDEVALKMEGDEKKMASYVKEELKKTIFKNDDTLNVLLMIDSKGIVYAAKRKNWKKIRDYFKTVHEEGKVDKIDEYIHEDVIHGFVELDHHHGRDKLKAGVKEMHKIFAKDRKTRQILKKSEGNKFYFTLEYSAINTKGEEMKLNSESEWEFKEGKIYKALAKVKEKDIKTRLGYKKDEMD